MMRGIIEQPRQLIAKKYFKIDGVAFSQIHIHPDSFHLKDTQPS
jgi:hypothetical protein